MKWSWTIQNFEDSEALSQNAVPGSTWIRTSPGAVTGGSRMWQVFPASRQLGLWAEPQVPPALPLALGLGSAVMF